MLASRGTRDANCLRDRNDLRFAPRTELGGVVLSGQLCSSLLHNWRAPTYEVLNLASPPLLVPPKSPSPRARGLLCRGSKVSAAVGSLDEEDLAGLADRVRSRFPSIPVRLTAAARDVGSCMRRELYEINVVGAGVAGSG